MSDENTGIYREILLEYYKNPRNFHEMKDSDIHKFDSNPTCGDEVEVFIKLKDKKEKDPTIEKLSFKGKGCVICMATTSMLMEELEGKKLLEIKSMDDKTITQMLDIKLTPTRLKCAMLSLVAIKKGIFEFESKK